MPRWLFNFLDDVMPTPTPNAWPPCHKRLALWWQKNRGKFKGS
jgi:hypothetical protein